MSAPLPELGPEGMLAMILDLMARNARPEVRVDAEVPVGRFRVWRGTFGELALVVPTEQDAAGLEAQLDDLFRPDRARITHVDRHLDTPDTVTIHVEGVEQW